MFNRVAHDLFNRHQHETEQSELVSIREQREFKTGVQTSVGYTGRFLLRVLVWPFPDLLPWLRWSHGEAARHYFIALSHRCVTFQQSSQTCLVALRHARCPKVRAGPKLKKTQESWFSDGFSLVCKELDRLGYWRLLPPYLSAYFSLPFCHTSLLWGKLITYLVHLRCHSSMKLLWVLSNECNGSLLWSPKVIIIVNISKICIMLDTLPLTHLILKTNLTEWYYYLYFVNEKTEEQRG